MADFLGANIIGTDRLIARFDAPVVPRVRAAVAEQTEILAQTVKERMAALFHNPGKMQAAVGTSMAESANAAEGTVYAEGLPYLRIQEYGGVTRPHDIFPRTASVLAFPAAGAFGFSGSGATEMVFARHVHHPGSRIPERSYMRSALALRRSAIIAAIREASFEPLALAAE
jgi:hypothetical protein